MTPMRLTSVLTWIGNDHTAIAVCPGGTRYTVEFDGQTYWLEVDGDVQMDVHPSMEDAQDAAETAAWLSCGRMTPVDVLNSRLVGAYTA
jgi:hypothetical protein